ncbi:ATP-binding protein [Marinibaculum pumilum]|uniref:histidine kinase n=1 Tax=Marinibaculum pumilum TaxID=1766165 RepID=A0ABV7KVJ0_9PROT
MTIPKRIADLDLAPQPSFDALTAAAARIFDAPIALILLQDGNRLLYKSKQGVDWLECPARGSFSRWMLAQHADSLLVKDALQDPQFHDDEAVTGALGIRFYAGATLVLESGDRIGAICVMDTRPHPQVTDADIALLAGLAGSASALIESHRQAEILKRLEARNRLSDELGEIALGGADYATALSDTAEVLGRHLGADIVLLGQYDPAAVGLRVTGGWSSRRRIAEELLANVAERALQENDSLCCAAIRDQAPVTVEDLVADPRFAGNLIVERLHQLGVLQYIVIPFRVGAERCGLSIGFCSSGNDLAAVQARVDEVRSRIASLLERKQAHERLAFLGSVLDETDEGMAILEIDLTAAGGRRFVYLNKAIATLTGYGREELLAGRADRLLPGIENPEEEARAEARIAAGEPVEVEVKCRQKSGETAWLNIRAIPYRAPAAFVSGASARRRYLIVSVRHVGERRRMLEVLRAQEARARKLFEQNPVPMWLYDRQTLAIQEVNASAIRQYGYSRQEFMAMRVPDLHPGDEQEALARHLARPRVGLREVGVWRQVGKDGTERYVKIVANDYAGEFGNWILVAALDVTREKDYERSLLQAKYQAEQANAIKSEFLGHMSHEMRTPLNAIIGYSEMIRSGIHGPLGIPKYAEYVDAIRDSGSELLVFVNDVLQLIEIDGSVLSLRPAEVALRALLSDLLRQYGEGFAENRIRLTEIRVPVELTVRADLRAVRQVLGHLLDNLVKFCPGAMVGIAAEVQADGRVAVRISDSGPGIAPEILQEIFSPFFSSHSMTRRAGQGAGLGLPICQRLLQAQDGDIRIDSRNGEGTQVTLLLPPADGQGAMVAAAGG